MKISFSELTSALPKAETLVFAVGEDKKFSPLLAAADKKSGGLVARALKASRFAGKKGQYLTVPVAESVGCARIWLAGIGKAADADAFAFQAAAGGLVPQLNAAGAKSATFVLDVKGAISAADAAANLAYGMQLRSYRFDKYRTTEKPEAKPTLSAFTVAVRGVAQAKSRFTRLEALAESIFFSRDLVTEPANVIYPQTLADQCKTLTKLGLSVQVLGVPEMKKLGMGALLGVGQGSVRESKLVIMQWHGGAKAQAPLAFVGKGVTFDTGGISIKPSDHMEDMKYDMGGSAAVIGLMRALAARKAKVNAVGVVGLVENMPDGGAQRPGDVVKSADGQTIEVLNTDAEGRLVLADALWYAQDKFKPKLVVDLATLTGAITVALGNCRAGLFSNDDKLAGQIFKAGTASGEEVWRMPMGDYYDRLIDSDIADVANSNYSREAGSTTAAQFLQRFIKKGTPWAHLDIAGVAWTKKDKDTCPKGATGFGIALLDRFVEENHE